MKGLAVEANRGADHHGMRLPKVSFQIILLIVLSITGSSLIAWDFTRAAPSPTITRTGTGGAVGPCSWFITIDGTTPVAMAMTGGLSVGPGNNVVGTAGQDMAAFLTPLQTNNQEFCFGPGVFTFTSTWTINTITSIVGTGPGLLWNAYEAAPTELKCALSSNNIPCIKILGTTGINVEKDSYTMLSNFKLFYSGASTGTDGIYMDGENGLIRHIEFQNINVLKFSGVGIHAKGTCFDVQFFGVGVVNSGDDNIRLEVGTPLTGNPSQWGFFGVVSLANAAGKFAMNVQISYDLTISGGTISGTTSANGLKIFGPSGGSPAFGIFISGTNFEGSGGGATGLIYGTGSDLRMYGGTLLSWTTGLQIGLSAGDGTIANNWFVDTNFSTDTTNVLINTGAPRIGILGIRSTASIGGGTITNNRATSDGVYTDLQEEFTGTSIPALANIVVGGSVFTYQNQNFYNEEVYVTGGTVSNVTIAQPAIAGREVSTTTNISVFVPPGWRVLVTYSVLPVMTKEYSGP